jgi:ABC-2 type transport system permease protein
MRDLVGVFFLFVFPLVIILMIGTVFGGEFTPRIGVHLGSDDEMSEAFVADLGERPDIEVELVDDRDALVDAVQRGTFEAGVALPVGYGADLTGGEDATVSFLGRPGTFAAAVRNTVEAVASGQGALVAAARVATTGEVTFEEGLARSQELQPQIPAVGVSSEVEGESEFEDVSAFTFGASQQFVLFVFLNSLASSIALIQSRRLGISARMLAAPIGTGTIILGEGVARFLVAFVQGIFVVVASALLFGVRWGDLLASGTLVLAFCLVGTGAAMLFGALFDNEQQAAGIATFSGLSLAALGGSMVPLEIFSDTMQTVAHATPHGWANDAFSEILLDGAGLMDILPQIAVLVGFAAVLLAAGSLLLRRKLVR